LRAQIAFASQRGRDAPPLLLEGGQAASSPGRAMARETYLEAIAAAMFAGRLGHLDQMTEVAEAPAASNPVPALGAAGRLSTPRDAVHRGVCGRRRVRSRGPLRAFVNPTAGGEDAVAVAGVPPRAGSWDDELWHVLATCGVRLARETGASACSERAQYLAALNVHSGRSHRCALTDESIRSRRLPESAVRYAACMLAAARGDEAPDLFDRAGGI